MAKPQNPRELALAIASQIEGVDATQVEQMFATWQAVQEGDPVGTVLRDQQTELVYIRVECDGLPKWRVVDPHDGNAVIFEMTPNLAHQVLYRDEAQVVQENEVAAAIEAAVIPAE